MAPHSSSLARQIPWTEEPGGLQSMGLLRVSSILLLSLVGDAFGFTHSSCHETSFVSLLNETLCVLDHEFVSSGVMEYIPK